MPSGRAARSTGEPARRRAAGVPWRVRSSSPTTRRSATRSPGGRRRWSISPPSRRCARRGGIPGGAWEVNAAGTARLAIRRASPPRGRPRRSTGPGGLDRRGLRAPARPAPRVETDPVRPVSPYAASKVGAEVAALEAWRRTGLRVVVARPFPHTGAGPEPGLRRAGLRRAAPGGAGVRGRDRDDGEPRARCAISSTSATWSRPTACCSSTARPGETYNVARGDGLSPRRGVRAARGAASGRAAVPAADPSLVRSRRHPASRRRFD